LQIENNISKLPKIFDFFSKKEIWKWFEKYFMFILYFISVVPIFCYFFTFF
jgi:hypothetical protein